MADDLDVTEMFRRAVQANVKFYQGWLDLSLDYVRGLSDIFATSSSSDQGDGVVDSPADDAGVLVMEGEEGTATRGAFLITNDLDRKVSCQLEASEFTDSDGKTVRPKVVFEPKTFELQPGEQRVVQAAVTIDRKLTTGFGYEGEFAIKGMEGISVPVVLRRRHRSDDISGSSGEPTGKEAAAGKPKAARTTRKRTTATKAKAAKKTPAKKKSSRKRVARQKG